MDVWRSRGAQGLRGIRKDEREHGKASPRRVLSEARIARGPDFRPRRRHGRWGGEQVLDLPVVEGADRRTVSNSRADQVARVSPAARWPSASTTSATGSKPSGWVPGSART